MQLFVAGRDDILECSGELSAGSWDDRKLTIPGQDTYVGFRNQGLPSYLRVRANDDLTSVDGLLFGSYLDDASHGKPVGNQRRLWFGVHGFFAY